jgi:hypothetical protein
MEDGGLFVTSEVLLWEQSKTLHHQIIAVRGILDVDGSITGSPGNFLGSRAAALSADDAAGPGTYEVGFNLSAGWKFENGVVIEGSWIHLFQAKYSAFAGIEPANARDNNLLTETFLTSFVFNFPADFAGPASKVNLGNPGATFGIWDASSSQEIRFTQRFDQFELTGRIPLYGDECNRTYWLVGPRLAWLWEQFWWRTVAFDVNTGQAGQDDVAIYTNTLSQRLYGLHWGCGYEWYQGNTPVGAFSLSLELQGALFIDVAKERAKYERGDFAIASQRARTDYTLVPEVQAKVNLWWYPFEAVQLRIGYDFMAFFNTISSPDPVDFNYGAVSPAWQKGTARLIDGLSAGVGIIF